MEPLKYAKLPDALSWAMKNSSRATEHLQSLDAELQPAEHANSPTCFVLRNEYHYSLLQRRMLTPNPSACKVAGCFVPRDEHPPRNKRKNAKPLDTLFCANYTTPCNREHLQLMDAELQTQWGEHAKSLNALFCALDKRNEHLQMDVELQTQ